MDRGDEAEASRPSSQPSRHVLGSTGMSMISMGVPQDGNLTARSMRSTRCGVPLASGGEDFLGDPYDAQRAAAEAQFFDSKAEKDRIHSARHKFPRRKTSSQSKSRGSGSDIDNLTREMTGEEDVQVVARRIAGFRLGFEKIFATTSIKLPVSAYTIFVEMRSSSSNEVWSRCFNGLHTVFDIKKWIFEKLLLPTNAYELSYAESGKAELTDDMRLLTTQESLDTRTLATTRAVHNMYKGIPGVHSINDIGVTRVYVRLKCRTCGDKLNSFQTCRKLKQFGHIEPPVEFLVPQVEDEASSKDAARSVLTTRTFTSPKVDNKITGRSGSSGVRQKGHPPPIEDGWYVPDEKKHCLFHTHGYELFQAARTHGGYADLARIFMSCNKEPSKLLNIGEKALSARAAPAKISY